MLVIRLHSMLQTPQITVCHRIVGAYFSLVYARTLLAHSLPPSPTHASPEKLKPSSQLLPWVSVGDALCGLPEPEEFHLLLNHVGSKYKVSDRNFTGHRRTDPGKPSPTILARGNGKGGVCAIQHPGNHRRMTVRESAIIQSFPLDFVFHGGLMSMYRQVGNAVPVRLAEAFGRSLVALESQL